MVETGDTIRSPSGEVNAHPWGGRDGDAASRTRTAPTARLLPACRSRQTCSARGRRLRANGSRRLIACTPLASKSKRTVHHSSHFRVDGQRPQRSERQGAHRPEIDTYDNGSEMVGVNTRHGKDWTCIYDAERLGNFTVDVSDQN